MVRAKKDASKLSLKDYSIRYSSRMKRWYCDVRRLDDPLKWIAVRVDASIAETQRPLAEAWIENWLERRSGATVAAVMTPNLQVKIDAILAEAFPAQRRFIADPSKRKAAFVLRRGGKSTLVGIYMISQALLNPATKSLYVGLTRWSAENTMWLNILEPLLLKHNIKYTFNKVKQLITFENKATIQLTGADASEKQITRYLGGKYIVAVFDECQSVTNDLKYWIKDCLGPAMTDYGGTICCIGTAGRSLGTYWYEITKPNSKLTSWSIHRWSGKDNTSVDQEGRTMAQKIEEEMQKQMLEEPGIELTEGFRNQWLCEWVLDTSDRVYHNTDRNILCDPEREASLQRCDTKWMYMIGFDFGYEDDTAFVVAAYERHDPKMYIVETFKEKHMITDQVAFKLFEYKNKYQPIYYVGDCQNKQLVQTLRVTYRLPLSAADKAGKEAHIAAMNSDFTTQKIQVIKSTNEELLREWAQLIWHPGKRQQGIFEEKASKENHAADAALYVHHFSKHYRMTPPPVVDDRNPMRIETERRIEQMRAMNNGTYGQNDTSDIYDHIENTRLGFGDK